MIIIQDTREQQGWEFFYPDIIVVREQMVSGDYTIRGRESDLIVERKATTGELANNIGKKWFQFCDEFQRVPADTRKVVICEFSQQDVDSFPINSGIPYRVRKYLKISSGLMKKRIAELESNYGVEFIFAGNKFNAQEIALGIFREYYEN